jgi:hypothetical protein
MNKNEQEMILTVSTVEKVYMEKLQPLPFRCGFRCASNKHNDRDFYGLATHEHSNLFLNRSSDPEQIGIGGTFRIMVLSSRSIA